MCRCDNLQKHTDVSGFENLTRLYYCFTTVCCA